MNIDTGAISRSYQQPLDISRTYNFLVMYFFLLTSISYFYLFCFYDNIVSGEWLYAGGYARILIPDTYLYLDLSNVDDIFDSAIYKNTKNAFGPTLVWFLFSGQWYYLIIFNAICSIISIMYTAKLLACYKITSIHKAIVRFSIIMFPLFFYYSIGSLKEIPTLLFLNASFFYLIRTSVPKLIIYSCLIVIFRYQLFFILIPIYVLYSLKVTKPLLFAFTILLIIGMFYPAVSRYEIFASDSATQYREQFGQYETIGAYVEKLREIYGVSFFAILIRTIQSMYEPIIGMIQSPTFYEEGNFSIYKLVHVLFNICVTPVYIAFFHRLLVSASTGFRRSGAKHQILYALISLSIFCIGGLSFIHGRYLFPIYGILFVAANLPLDRSKSLTDS